jgi:B-cell receptor-associated protein 31
MGAERMEVQARKFYSQRNMYLCGFTLFLSLILNRTYVMILDVLRLEEELKSYKGDSSAKGKAAASLGQAGAPGEIAKLKKELEAKDRDIANLKKQAEGLTREYNRMGDQVSPSDNAPKKDK